MNTNTLEDTWKKIRGEVRHRWDRLTHDGYPDAASRAHRLVGTAQRKVERGAEQVLYKLGRRRRPAGRLRRMTDRMSSVVNWLIDECSWYGHGPRLVTGAGSTVPFSSWMMGGELIRLRNCAYLHNGSPR